MKKIIFLSLIILKFLFGGNTEKIKMYCFDICLNSNKNGKYTSGKAIFQNRINCNKSNENILDTKFYYKIFYKESNGLPIKYETYKIKNNSLVETVYLNKQFHAKKITTYNKYKNISCIFDYNKIDIPKDIYIIKNLPYKLKDYSLFESVVKKCDNNTKTINLSLYKDKSSYKLFSIYYNNSKLNKIKTLNNNIIYTYNKNGVLINIEKVPVGANTLPIRIPGLDDYPFLDRKTANKKWVEKLKKMNL